MIGSGRGSACSEGISECVEPNRALDRTRDESSANSKGRRARRSATSLDPETLLDHSRWHCMDCAKDTDSAQEFYALRDDLWRMIVRRPRRGGMLCLNCVERRLGRPLHRLDFKPVPVNAGQAAVCQALADRLARPAPRQHIIATWQARRAQYTSIDTLRTARKWRRR
jgi:hypothetical protein